MLKKSREHSPKANLKKGSNKQSYQGPLASGLNRRAFLKTSTAISLLAGFAACKPSVPADSGDMPDIKRPLLTKGKYFSKQQQIVLDAVQMKLFPADGNGPSARELNAIEYLEWAMSDPKNIDDGDPEFIAKGIAWLNELSDQTQGDAFIQLNSDQQDKVLKQISTSSTGENWLSILLYYLTEALMLDPVYGGNPEGIGWKWLAHQPGFPAPVLGQTYRDFK